MAGVPGAGAHQQGVHAHGELGLGLVAGVPGAGVHEQGVTCALQTKVLLGGTLLIEKSGIAFLRSLIL